MPRKALRFLIAPDKFKGSLSATQAAAAIREGILSRVPNAICRVLPMADGGEGTCDVFVAAGLGERVAAPTNDALGRSITSHYVRLNDGKGAVIEMAAAAGIAQIAEADRNPLVSTTTGVGRLMNHAAALGASEIWIGLGGSATNDAGCGMAHALGWRFLDAEGGEFLPLPKALHRLATICPPRHTFPPRCFVLADVANPLLGPRGCSCVYGPQKGADPAAIEPLEAALERLARIAAECLGIDHRLTPGAGAAGGMGYGLLTFCNATLLPGFETLAKLAGFEHAIAETDIVVTGEGCLDGQSIEGKGPVALARMARNAGKLAVCIAGAVDIASGAAEEFDGALALANRPMSVEESRRDAARLLRHAAAQAAGLLNARF